MGNPVQGIDAFESGQPLGNGVLRHGYHMHRGNRNQHSVLGRHIHIDLVESNPPAGNDPQILGRSVETRSEKRRVGNHPHHALGVLGAHFVGGIKLHIRQFAQIFYALPARLRSEIFVLKNSRQQNFVCHAAPFFVIEFSSLGPSKKINQRAYTV